ncbi:hypothetical protein Fmac_011680 [Flemingia macrophylla]|uniref:Uncharacterized protein n=1 Tax=Flemingia macrophylla TaxID=520843 RepID=A0ABD1MN83_9FABA
MRVRKILLQCHQTCSTTLDIKDHLVDGMKSFPRLARRVLDGDQDLFVNKNDGPFKNATEIWDHED